MKKCFILAALLLAGCAAQGEAIYLARGDSHVKCGPYSGSAVDYLIAYDTSDVNRANNSALRACVSDYQRQGYQRVPGPSSN